MAKKEKGNARTTLEGVNDSLTSLEQKFEKNKKYIYWALGIVAAIILAVLAYVYLIMKPAKENDRIATSKADMALFDQGKNEDALKQYQAIANNSSYASADRLHTWLPSCSISRLCKRPMPRRQLKTIKKLPTCSRSAMLKANSLVLLPNHSLVTAM